MVQDCGREEQPDLQATVVLVVIKFKDGEGLNQSNGKKRGRVNGNAEDLRPDQE